MSYKKSDPTRQINQAATWLLSYFSGSRVVLSAVLISLIATTSVLSQATVYDAINSPLAPNYPSVGFQALQAAEFGDYVHLGGTDRKLSTVSVTMSNWALKNTPANVAYCSANPAKCTPAGFYHPITVSIYNLGAGTPGTRAKGSTITTFTEEKFIPWRPVADPTCAGGTAWRASNGNCYSGYAFNVTFDMSSLNVTLPNSVIVGISYNTQTYGSAPMGVDGPYNSLNVALSGTASAGSDDNADYLFWNTSTGGWYADGGTAGVGVFREDSDWGTYGPVPIRITTSNKLLVRPSSQLDWVASTGTGGTVGFVADATAPSGDGALHLTTIGDNASRTQYTRVVNMPLADLDQASYWSKTISGPNASAGPSYAIGVYLDGTPASFTSLAFEPYWNTGTGTVPTGVWQYWDFHGASQLWASRTVNAGGSCVTTAGSGGPPFYTIDGIKAACPNAVVVSHSVYMGTYNPNFDTYVDLVNFNGTQWDFEPDPATVVVDDDGAASATDCDAADGASTTIQAGINAAVAGQIVKVCPGNYVEDVNVNKANLILQGSGVDVSTITGPHTTGDGNTVLVTASGVTVDGFTITRTGNNTTDWAANTQNQGINVAASSNFTLQNSKLTGNRNAIYVGQSSHNVIIRRNIIDFNRTGIHLVDNNGALIEQNFIRDNWTMGVLYRSEGGPIDPSPMTVRNNNISGNWYSQVEFREPAGSSLLNMSGNYLGTTNPTRVTTTSLEPGYAGQIPVAYGGSSTPPASPTGTIAGPQSARIDYSPFLNSGTDLQPGTPGFQGDFANVTTNSDSPQAGGPIGNIQEAIGAALAGGSVTARNGTFAGDVLVNKAVTLRGTPTITGALSVVSAGAVISPGFSPGIINSGNLSLTSGSNVAIELNGLTPGSGHDQLNVTGTVSLGNSTLNVSTSFGIASGNSFVIVNNDGADAVTGTFAGLAEGSTFVVSGVTFSISYTGGTGNDVVLSAASVTCGTVSIPTAIPTLTGVQVEVPINTTDLTSRGAFGYETTITYNTSVLDYIAVDAVGTMSSGLTIETNEPAAGTLSITAFSTGPDPLAGAGTLLKVRFQVIGPISPTPTPVNFSSFVFNEGSPCSNTTNGSVQIISGTLSGNVTYVNGSPTTPGVPNVNMSGVGVGGNVATTTDSSGNYSLSGFGAGSYTVTPSKASLPSGSTNTAISNVDSTRIAQYTVGLATLTANQIIAGDVTGNGTVSNLDATYISQWKVGISNPGVTGTWIFQPTSRTYLNMNASVAGENYNAILKGDVTGNWNPLEAPGLFDVSAERSKDAIAVSAGSTKSSSGSSIVIPIEISDLTSKGVTGYEFELAYDPTVLEPEEIAAELTGTLSEGMSFAANAPEPGRLMVVVFGVNEMAGGGNLINLRFNVIGPVGTETGLTINGLVLNEGEIKSYPVNGSVRVVESRGPSIRGTVMDGSGNGLIGARVTATNSKGVAIAARTGNGGIFSFGGLEIGETYTISVESEDMSFQAVVVSLVNETIDLALMAR